MMELFSIFDAVAERYMKPFWATNVGSAIRGFEDACKDPETPFFSHPEDYFLYHVAIFDDVTGEIAPVIPAHKVASATSFPTLEVDKVQLEGRA